MLSLMPSKVKELWEFLKTAGKEVGDFPRTIRFLNTVTENSQAKTMPYRAILFVQSALPVNELGKLQSGKAAGHLSTHRKFA